MSWFQHGDVRIWYEVAGEGPPVLLLPGFSDTIDAHAALRDTLAPRYRVIAADLPGSGKSQPQPRQYYPDYYRDDALAFLALLDALGADRPHVLGFSDGGEVALMLAAHAPDRPRSVLTWGAAGHGEDPDGKIADLFRNVMSGTASPFPGYRDYLAQRYGEDVARAMTRSFADNVSALIAAGGDISLSLAHRVTCPVLLLTGENDSFNPFRLLEAYVARAQQAEAEEVPGAGHGIHEDRPDWFLNRVQAWLSRH